MRTLFEISKSGMASAQRSLAVTSSNIVNADTPGYTRQRVEKSPVGMNMGNRHVGLGVNISTANRLRNDMNDVLTDQKRQDLGFMNYKNEVFERLQASMTTDSGGDLDVKISQLFDAFSELATDPQDKSVRNNLLSQAQELTNKFSNISQTVSDTSDLVQDAAGSTIVQINTLLADIGALNESISMSGSKGDPDATSLDLRVRKLQELSELVAFDRSNGKNGAIEIRIGGIQVLGEEGVEQLRSEIDVHENTFNIRLKSGTLVEVNGGELGSQIELYSNDLPDLQTKLDRLAEVIVTEFNTIHSSGFGLDDATSRNFFDPTGIMASSMQINPALLGNPDHIAAADVAGEAGNGKLASQIAELRNASISEGRKLVDHSIEIISTPGSSINRLNGQIETREAEIAMLQTQQERAAGVNIDEELALMIQFQNSYQGAARIMSTAQELYDTLLGIIR